MISNLHQIGELRTRYVSSLTTLRLKRGTAVGRSLRFGISRLQQYARDCVHISLYDCILGQGSLNIKRSTTRVAQETWRNSNQFSELIIYELKACDGRYYRNVYIHKPLAPCSGRKSKDEQGWRGCSIVFTASMTSAVLAPNSKIPSKPCAVCIITQVGHQQLTHLLC
jgi:hypothetical protein